MVKEGIEENAKKDQGRWCENDMKLGLTKADVIMVGDNYETDIQAGIRNGIDTLLVLSGFTKAEDVPLLPVPATHVLRSLDEWSF